MPVHLVDAPSILFSLAEPTTDARLSTPLHPFLSRPNPLNVLRIDQVINGRPYQILVSSVGTNKWRAQIARTPGGSAATMPFYGDTPDEAATHLSRWLTLAHGQPRPQI